MVFAIKAAVLPLHFWLPATYAEAPPPVAALFAIMTKVGAYAILRMQTLAFPAELAHTAGHFETLLMPAALADAGGRHDRRPRRRCGWSGWRPLR